MLSFALRPTSKLVVFKNASWQSWVLKEDLSPSLGIESNLSDAVLETAESAFNAGLSPTDLLPIASRSVSTELESEEERRPNAFSAVSEHVWFASAP